MRPRLPSSARALPHRRPWTSGTSPSVLGRTTTGTRWQALEPSLGREEHGVRNTQQSHTVRSPTAPCLQARLSVCCPRRSPCPAPAGTEHSIIPANAADEHVTLSIHQLLLSPQDWSSSPVGSVLLLQPQQRAKCPVCGEPATLLCCAQPSRRGAQVCLPFLCGDSGPRGDPI